jgi:hypothetical protein
MGKNREQISKEKIADLFEKSGGGDSERQYKILKTAKKLKRKLLGFWPLVLRIKTLDEIGQALVKSNVNSEEYSSREIAEALTNYAVLYHIEASDSMNGDCEQYHFLNFKRQNSHGTNFEVFLNIDPAVAIPSELEEIYILDRNDAIK